MCALVANSRRRPVYAHEALLACAAFGVFGAEGEWLCLLC